MHYVQELHLDVVCLQSCCARITLVLKPLMAVRSSPSLGMGSPFEDTLPYRAMRSAVWMRSDILFAFGVQSVAALNQPLRLCHSSFVGSSAARCPSIFSAAAAVCFAQSPLSPAAICLLMRRVVCCNSFPCCRSTTHFLMSAHVGAEICWLRGWACVGGATTSRQSSSKRVGSSS